MIGAARGPAVAMVLASAVALAGCGGEDAERSRDADPFADIRAPSPEAAAGTRDAAPRWESVATLRGSGDAVRPFSVARDAIEWRARWRCRTGRLRLAAGAGDKRTKVADARCPARGTSSGSGTGPLSLAVASSAPWQVKIEQQVDTPLREPPTAAMRAPGARVLARGRFYDLERTGRGTATLYRLASGRLALRFDGGFAVSANTDLFVWLSKAARPRTTVAAVRAPYRTLRLLKSTLGSQNYVLPRGTRPRDVRSIVIWCEPVRIAYAAAALRPR